MVLSPSPSCGQTFCKQFRNKHARCEHLAGRRSRFTFSSDPERVARGTRGGKAERWKGGAAVVPGRPRGLVNGIYGAPMAGLIISAIMLHFQIPRARVPRVCGLCSQPPAPWRRHRSPVPRSQSLVIGPSSSVFGGISLLSWRTTANVLTNPAADATRTPRPINAKSRPLAFVSGGGEALNDLAPR